MDTPHLTGKLAFESTTPWRWCWWARRKYFDALQAGYRAGTYSKTCERAKSYRHLVNDALFFENDPRERFSRLIRAHYKHPKLALSAASELDCGDPKFNDPPKSSSFLAALYNGEHFPIQACLLVQMRARLYVLKTAVDYWIARRDGALPPDQIWRLAGIDIDLSAGSLTDRFREAVEHYEGFDWFPRLPVLWQAILGIWGGFILTDRNEQEYEALSNHAGIPTTDLPAALEAFDRFVPMEGGWWVQPANDSRLVLKMMPAAIRGIGAVHRRRRYGVGDYTGLGYTDKTTRRLKQDEATAYRLFTSTGAQLVK